MQLSNLPNELLALLVSFFECECDLNSFSQANKHLYLLFNHALYKRNAGENPCSSALQWAAQHGKQATARKALAAGATPFPRAYVNHAPMGLAAMNGHEALVRLFLARVKPNYEHDWHHMHEPLFLAAEHGHGSIIQLLAKHGASVYKYDSAKESYPKPLELAIKYGGDLDTIKLLTDAHDDRQIQYIGSFALTTAAGSGHLGAAPHFFSKRVDPSWYDDRTGDFPMDQAAENGHLEIVRLLFDNGVQIDPKVPESLLLPLTLAAGNKHYAVAEFLASTCLEEVIRAEDALMRATILAVAAMCGWEGVVGKLLKLGCPPDMKGQNYDQVGWNKGLTSLGRAAENGNEGVVQQLLQQGADPNPKYGVDGIPDCPLIQAISKGHLEIAQRLQNSGARMCCDGHRCHCGSLALLEAIQFQPIVVLLLATGANPQATTSKMSIPLQGHLNPATSLWYKCYGIKEPGSKPLISGLDHLC